MSSDASHLREWSKGIYSLEAATELLIRFAGGRFLDRGWPWVRFEGDRLWIDFEAISSDNLGGLSGGERRVLNIIASLGGAAPVNLSDSMSGLDRNRIDLVLAAIAHANGSHESATLLFGDGQTYTAVKEASLHPWPPGLESDKNTLSS